MECLPVGEIHVWLLRRPQQLDNALLAWVTPEEQARAQAMTSVRRQCEWLAGRALLRQCLACYTGQDARALVLGKTAAGKPVLELPGAPAFSLSHGPLWVGCAVAQAEVIGIDIDSAARRNRTDEIAGRYFHPQEQAAMAQAADEAGRRLAFFRSWTLKEAYIKALGLTLNGARLQALGFAVDGQPLFAPAGHWQFVHRCQAGDQHLALACRWRECDTVSEKALRCRFRLWDPVAQSRHDMSDEWQC